MWHNIGKGDHVFPLENKEKEKAPDGQQSDHEKGSSISILGLCIE